MGSAGPAGCDDHGSVDTTLGSMAVFYSKNMDILRSDISEKARRFVRESIFDYSELRNGYFHKHNIHSWSKIEEIRNESFNMIFLLLGAQALNNSDIRQLGFVEEEQSNDFYKLCEYFNYHSGEIFFIKTPHDNEDIFIACSDYLATVSSDGRMIYSGVYIRGIGKNAPRFKIAETSLPKEISLGKFVYAQTEKISITTMKVKTIFENGRFVGPSIAEEDALDY